MNSIAHTALRNTPAAPAKPVSIAFLLGCSDGESGALCLPELYFWRREFALEYVAGHELAAGETMLSRQYKQLNGVQA